MRSAVIAAEHSFEERTKIPKHPNSDVGLGIQMFHLLETNTRELDKGINHVGLMLKQNANVNTIVLNVVLK